MLQITGLLLTRQWRDQANGIQLCYWVYTQQGARRLVINQQEAVCFIASHQEAQFSLLLQNQPGWRTRPLPLKSFTNVAVHAVYFRSQRLLHQIRDLCEQHGISLWEADIRTVDRYLSERFITGDLTALFDSDSASDSPRLTRAEPTEVNLLCASLDIETAMDGSQLYSIAVHAFDSEALEINQVFMLGQGNAEQADDCPIAWFEREADLLNGFLRWFQQLDPDLIIGWNVINFDLRFLQQRCDQLKLPFTLGRNNEAPEWRQARDENQHYFVLVPGRVVLDGIDTLKAATWNFESFALENVARQLLERGKLIHDVTNRGVAISELFQRDKMALARYNLEDCRLVSDIFAKADLLSFAVERSRLTGLPMDKVGGSVAAFENLYLPRLHRAGYVAPNIGEMQSEIAAPGGYVMQSQPGLYEHVLVLDFKSLYPSIIRTFCIDPLALIKGRFESDRNEFPAAVFQRASDAASSAEAEWVPGFHGALFSKSQHLLPDIIKRLWEARDQAKLHNNAPLSQAIKIIMNSFYGVLGTPLCRFFDPLLSSSITLRGHDIMLQTRLLIEQRGHKVIYGDTDSVFVWLSQVRSSEQARSTGSELAAALNQWWSIQIEELFGLQSCLELEFETHYRHFFMPTMRGSETGSKKRYAGLIEVTGEQQPITEKLVFKGLEYVRTDWTQLARRVQYDVCWNVFHRQDPVPYLREVINKLYAGDLDQELIYRKRIRRKLSDYQKNVPPHVQAARKADDWLRSRQQKAQYFRGGWISYVITRSGPEPMEHVVSAMDYDHYLSRQLAPAVDGLLQCLGTSVEHIVQSQLSLF